MLAALTLATAAYAQTPTPEQTAPQPSTEPQPGQTNPGRPSPDTQAAPGQDQSTYPGTGTQNPNAASSPHQRDVTSQPGNESPPNPNPNPHAASSPHQRAVTRLAEANITSGTAVQSETGSRLGFVANVVPGSSGTQQSGYVVIAGSGGTATPVPYGTASSMLKDGKIVIDRARFEGAPKVPQSKIGSTTGWKKKADSYWGESGSHTGQMSGEDHMRSEQPGDQPTEPPR
jgi:hypothetical protein